MREGLTPFTDADGRRWLLCEMCLPDVREADKAVRAARKLAAEARRRERAGQSTLFGRGPTDGPAQAEIDL
jgi:hypothetical protein